MDGDYVPTNSAGDDSQQHTTESGPTADDNESASNNPTNANTEHGDTAGNNASDNDDGPIPPPTAFEQQHPIRTPQSLGVLNPNASQRPTTILPSRHNRNSPSRINLGILHRPSNTNSNTSVAPTTANSTLAPPPPRPFMPNTEQTSGKVEADDDVPDITTEDWICDEEWADLDPQWTSLLPDRSLFVPNTRSSSFYNPTNPWQTYYWLIGQLRSDLNRFTVASGGSVETSMRNCFIGMFISAAAGSTSPHNTGTTAFGNYAISLLCTTLKGRRLVGRLQSKSYASYSMDRANALRKYPSRKIHRITGKFIVDLSNSQPNASRRISADQYRQAVATFRSSNTYAIDEERLQSCLDTLNQPAAAIQYSNPSRKRSPPKPVSRSQTESSTPVRKRARKNSTSNSNLAAPSMSSLGASYGTGILPATNDTSEFDILLRGRDTTTTTAQPTSGQNQMTDPSMSNQTPGGPSDSSGWTGNPVPQTASPTTSPRHPDSVFATAWNVCDYFGADHLAGAIATLSNELSYPDDLDFYYIAELIQRIVGFAVYMLQDLVNFCVTISRAELANKQSQWAKIADNGIIWLISFGATAQEPFWRDLIYSLLHLRPPSRDTPEAARNCFRKFTNLRISSKLSCPDGCVLSWPHFMKPFGAELNPITLQTLLSYWSSKHQESCIWRVNAQSRKWYRATPATSTPTPREPRQGPSFDAILAMAVDIGDDDCKVDTTSLVTSLPDNAVPDTTQSRNYTEQQQVSWDDNADNDTPPPPPPRRQIPQQSQRSGATASSHSAAPRRSVPSTSNQRVGRLRGGNPTSTTTHSASHPAPPVPIVPIDDEDGKQQTLSNPINTHTPHLHGQAAGSAPRPRLLPTNILSSSIDTTATTLSPRSNNPYRDDIMRIPYRVEQGLELQMLRGRDPTVFLATVALGRDTSSSASTAANTQLSHALNLGNKPAALQLEGIVLSFLVCIPSVSLLVML